MQVQSFDEVGAPSRLRHSEDRFVCAMYVNEETGVKVATTWGRLPIGYSARRYFKYHNLHARSLGLRPVAYVIWKGKR